jgi:hypothetical protein
MAIAAIAPITVTTKRSSNIVYPRRLCLIALEFAGYVIVNESRTQVDGRWEKTPGTAGPQIARCPFCTTTNVVDITIAGS